MKATKGNPKTWHSEMSCLQNLTEATIWSFPFSQLILSISEGMALALCTVPIGKLAEMGISCTKLAISLQLLM